MHWAFVASHGLSLVVESRGYSLVVVSGLTVVASLVTEHRLNCCGPYGLMALQHVRCYRSGIEPSFPALAGRFFTTEPPGKSF